MLIKVTYISSVISWAEFNNQLAKREITSKIKLPNFKPELAFNKSNMLLFLENTKELDLQLPFCILLDTIETRIISVLCMSLNMHTL